MLRLLPSAGTPRVPLRGMLVYALALLFFSGMDAVSRYLALRHPVPQVAWLRYGVHLLLMTVIFGPSMGRTLLHTQRRALILLRSLCLFFITLFMMFALRRLPLAEATSILFVAPLLVVLLARPVLQERIGVVRWVAVLVGFSGVLLVVRPGGDLDAIGVGFALMTALAGTAYQLMTRILSHTENPIVMLYYSALVGTVLFGVSLPWFWFEAMPSLLDAVLYGSLGVLGFVGHLCFTLAYRDAPASLLAPVTYLQLVWAGLLGWLIFGQLPDGYTLLGMLIVAASGIVVAIAGRAQDDVAG
ncbi:DMT family transporter [Uliginosibacterium sp. H3]|uniref:DMT family transporter n=1 Tax=Uliginosibacterium silvisoli TaxID=3114758 RepID=A0ABU6K6R2_9RHOO|nr:DMT family transporter [Uliginosibacterium sp. H3]